MVHVLQHQLSLAICGGRRLGARSGTTKVLHLCTDLAQALHDVGCHLLGLWCLDEAQEAGFVGAPAKRLPLRLEVCEVHGRSACKCVRTIGRPRNTGQKMADEVASRIVKLMNLPSPVK